MKKNVKRTFAIFLVIILLLNSISPIMKVFAFASTSTLKITFREGSENKGKVQYSVDDGAHWIDVEKNLNDASITMQGDNLRLRIVAQEGYSVDWAGIEYYEDDTRYELNQSENSPIAGGLTSDNGYLASATANFVKLEMVEFREGENMGPHGGPVPIPGGTKVEGSFTYTPDEEPADIWLNETEIGVGEPPAESAEYYYVESTGKVTFHFAVLLLAKLETVTINGIDYSSQLPKTSEELLESFEAQRYHAYVEVPYATSYDIKTTTTRDFEIPVGNFLWENDESQLNDENRDDIIGHGTFDIVSLKYKGVTYSKDELQDLGKDYLDWSDGIVTDGDPDGSTGGAVLPTGSELTVKLIPEAGYQLTSLTINGQAFEAGEKIGIYTFEVPSGNFHLGADFTKVENVVKANSEKVASGSISLGGTESSMSIGTARLDVSDVELTSEHKDKFAKAAEGYNIANYVDLSLYNTVYKGKTTESWDTEVTELNNKATINLKLEDGVDGEVALVHEKHDGTYEIIPATYDSKTKTATFKTDSFSNYAIATKKIAKSEGTTNTLSNNVGNNVNNTANVINSTNNTTNTQAVTKTTKNPKTGDNIVLFSVIFGVAVVGMVITFVVSKKRKNSSKK